MDKKKLVLIWFAPLTILLSHFIQIMIPSSPILQYIFSNINKKNFINRFIVKKGWFWSSLIGWWNIFIRDPIPLRNGGTTRMENAQRRRSVWRRCTETPAHRFLVLLFFWYLCTQSMVFYHGSLIDLVFKITGGNCHPPSFVTDGIPLTDEGNGGGVELTKWVNRFSQVLLKYMESNNSKWSILDYILQNKDQFFKNEFMKIISMENAHLNSNYCKKIGGLWIGGIDISGHVFLLNLMIWWLLGEHMIYSSHLKSTKKEKYNNDGDGDDKKKKKFKLMNKFKREKTKTKGEFFWNLCNIVFVQKSWILVYILAFIWWYNFLLTCVGFHTFGEKYWALLVSYIITWKIYIT